MKRLISVSIVLSGPLIILLATGCGGGGGGRAGGGGGTGGSGQVEWHLREFADKGVSVNVPAGWHVTRSGVFRASSKDHLASIMMKRTSPHRGTGATTAAELLDVTVESMEKNEFRQPLTRLDRGQMQIAGTTGEWVELSYQNPPTWLRVTSFIADKPYTITCVATKKDAIPQAEEHREFSVEEYRDQLIKISKSVRCNQTIGD